MKDLEQAIETIGNRLADNKLVNRVIDFLGDDIPVVRDSNTVPVMLAPYVAGGTNAEVAFVREADMSDAVPLITTYVEDAFTITNAAKVNTWRPAIEWPDGQRTRTWAVDAIYRANDTASVGNAETIYGCSVQEYQRTLARQAFASARIANPPTVIDLSAWYGRQSQRSGSERSASAYYPAVMALSSIFGILYRYEADNPLTARFRREVADPAAQYVREILGVEPIIVSRAPLAAGKVTDLRQLDQESAMRLRNYGTIGGDDETPTA